jgi:hypothetical protein
MKKTIIILVVAFAALALVAGVAEAKTKPTPPYLPTVVASRATWNVANKYGEQQIDDADTIYDAKNIPAPVCKRVNRGVIDCLGIVELYVTSEDPDTLYDEGKRCTFVLRVRRYHASRQTRVVTTAYFRDDSIGNDIGNVLTCTQLP